MKKRSWFVAFFVIHTKCHRLYRNSYITFIVKGELNPKIDFSPFEHLGIVEQLYEVFLSCKTSSSEKFDVL